MQKVDVDWLMFNRKHLLDKYLVEFKSYGDTSLVHNVGRITEVIVNDFHLQLNTESDAWFAVGWDAEPKPKIELDDYSVLIDHTALGIRYQIILR